MALRKKKAEAQSETQPREASDEAYTCDYCNKAVNSERVLVLTTAGQVGRHPDCHEFGKAMR